jgi:hypothetical protein
MTSSPKKQLEPVVDHISLQSRSKSIAEGSNYQPYFDKEEAVALSVELKGPAAEHPEKLTISCEAGQLPPSETAPKAADDIKDLADQQQDNNEMLSEFHKTSSMVDSTKLVEEEEGYGSPSNLEAKAD